MKSFLRHLARRWTWRMAWRDTRRGRRRLLLFSTSIVLGIAALTAIGSFRRQMETAIHEQSKALLGADLVVGARDPFPAEQEAVLESLGGERAREVRFSSMAFVPRTQDSRLVQVRALSGEFPFYGELETSPATAVAAFRAGRGLLVEESFLIQFGLAAGDELKIGEATFPVLGALRKVPGENIAFATLAPRVYLPHHRLEETQLLTAASLERYRVYYKIPSPDRLTTALERARAVSDRFRWGIETVEDRKEDLGRALTNLHHFLSLAGLMAALLGGVGIASAMQVHMKQRRGTAAILRCLGAGPGQALAVFVAQGAGIGFAGALMGVLSGLGVQWLVPQVAASYTSLPLRFDLYWTTLAASFALGFGISLLFALLPLLAARRVSPLAALRISYEEKSNIDPLVWGCHAVLLSALLIFSVTQSRRWQEGVGFVAGLLVAFVVLALLARVAVRLVRGWSPRFLPYVARQGLANLHRPDNRTVLVVLSLGLGTFLMLSIFLVQRTLMAGLMPDPSGTRGNAVLFDVQPDQREAVEGLLREHGLPVLQEAPVVTMRLASVKGRPVEELRRAPDSRIPRWVLQREYRSTYRARLADSEKLAAGVWRERADPADEVVPVSIETGLADNLEVRLGDELVFDVQGVPVRTRVASLREVEWRRLQPNFFVVFPPGVLEEAPAFHVLVTRAATPEQSGAMQREVVRRFSNVSVVDLAFVLQTVDTVLGRVGWVVRFMALFTVGTGLLVLVGAMLTGRGQRVQESMLLRTLGASRRQVGWILLVEHLALGGLAALSGAGLAVGGSWALARWVFQVEYRFLPLPVLGAVLVVAGLTAGVGWLMSRRAGDPPPLEILRSEM